jgi:hypothetical protein
VLGIDGPVLKPGEELDRFQPGQVEVEAQFSGQIADARPGFQALPPAILAEDVRLAAGRPEQVEQQPDGGRLARAVETEEPENFAWVNVQGQLVEGEEPSIAFGQSAKGNRRFGGRRGKRYLTGRRQMDWLCLHSALIRQGKTPPVTPVNVASVTNSVISKAAFHHVLRQPWDGPDYLRSKIDQLLGYASWRDTKTAILVFNRNKNLSVLSQIPDLVCQHPNCKRHDSKFRHESGFRFVLHHRNDSSRDLILLDGAGL